MIIRTNTALLCCALWFAVLIASAFAQLRPSGEIDRLCPKANKWSVAYRLENGEGSVEIKCSNIGGPWPRQLWEFRNTSPHPLKVTYSYKMFGHKNRSTAYLSVGGTSSDSNWSKEQPDVHILGVETLRLLSPTERQGLASRGYSGGLSVVETKLLYRTDDSGGAYTHGLIADASKIGPRSGVDAYTSPAKNREDPHANWPGSSRLEGQLPEVQYRTAPDERGAPTLVLGSATPRGRAVGPNQPGMHYVPSFEFLNGGAQPVKKISWEYLIYEDAGMNRLIGSYQGKESFRGKGVRRGEFGTVVGGQRVAAGYFGLPRRVIFKRVEYADGSVWERAEDNKRD